MRKNQVTSKSADFKIIAVDDEQGILDSLSIFMKRSGYDFVGITDPIEAINRVKTVWFNGTGFYYGSNSWWQSRRRN